MGQAFTFCTHFPTPLHGTFQFSTEARAVLPTGRVGLAPRGPWIQGAQGGPNNNPDTDVDADCDRALYSRIFFSCTSLVYKG